MYWVSKEYEIVTLKVNLIFFQFFVGSLSPQLKPIIVWSDYFARTPRYAGLLTSGPATKKSGSEPGVIDLLGQTLQSYTNDLRYLKSKPDKTVSL